jgi:glycosyltransferase involved in cell wall biosynthesis
VTTVLHVVDLPCPNPWLNGVAVNHDRARFRHLVASIGPRNAMHEHLERLGVRCLALDAAARTRWPLAVARLARVLRREQVDVVQAHLFAPGLIGLAAGKLAGTPFKVVTRHHADFTTIYNKPIHRRLDRWMALSADRVMAASEAVRRAMVRYESVPEGRIEVGRYGYDFEALRPRLSAARRRELRESLGGDANFLVGTVARLSIEKGHEYLFRAIPEVVRCHPETRFVLVGTGPLRGDLEEAAQAAGIIGHVRFTGWRTDAQDIMEAMDLVVHPTLHEAFCSVIIEGMALERPMVVTDVAAAPEQVDHGETGLLVPPRDPAAIAAAILELRGDPERAGEMGREARRRVVERFNFPKMMREYEEFYERLTGSKAAPVLAHAGHS